MLAGKVNWSPTYIDHFGHTLIIKLQAIDLMD